jgi:hypothetical protein
MKVTTKVSPKLVTKVNTKISIANTITNKATSEATSVEIEEATNQEVVVVKTVAEEVVTTIREASDKITINSKLRNPSTTKDKQYHVNSRCLNQ